MGKRMCAACLVLGMAILTMGCTAVPVSGESGLAGITVVVDAGHGDTDVGTIGVSTGRYEKEVNLEIAKKLVDALRERGAVVIMTREDDAPLGPADEEDVAKRKEADMLRREEIIAEANADIVLSIHQNNYEDPAVKGPQIFFLRDPATGTERGERLAKSLQDALNRELQVDSARNIGAGNWRLLKQGDQPGCIVECGFFSNQEEELLLQTEAYQDAIVNALMKGLDSYVRAYGV